MFEKMQNVLSGAKKICFTVAISNLKVMDKNHSIEIENEVRRIS